jgi:transcription elongation factor Elf1
MPEKLRCRCVCAACRRQVELSFDLRLRSHAIECDRCGQPMVCEIASGDEPVPVEPVWRDLPEAGFLTLA